MAVIPGEFEVGFGSLTPLSGTITAEIGEVDGVAPTSIIRDTEAWFVKLHWELKGPMLPLLSGKWLINLFMERMGPGDDLILPNPGNYELLITDSSGKYDYQIDVPAGVAKAENFNIPYKLVATVTYKSPFGEPGPIAGFVETGVVQFYHAHF